MLLRLILLADLSKFDQPHCGKSIPIQVLEIVWSRSTPLLPLRLEPHLPR
jgi:hypothetical protein